MQKHWEQFVDAHPILFRALFFLGICIAFGLMNAHAASAAVTDNIVSYYKADESSGNAADATGNALDLTNNGTVTFSTGQINNAAYFSGASTMYFSHSNNSNFYNLGHSSDLTIAGWVYFTNTSPSSGTFYSLYSQETTANCGAPAYNIGWGNEGGTLRFQFVTSSGSPCGQQAAARISWTATAGWHYIVFTYTHSTGSVAVYVDGSSIGTATTNATVIQGDGNFQVGKSTGFGNTMTGRLDEIGIWSRVLSGAEITKLYNAGTGLQYPFSLTAPFQIWPFAFA